MNTLHINDERTGVIHTVKKDNIVEVQAELKEDFYNVSIITSKNEIVIPMDGQALQGFLRWYNDENNLQVTIPAPKAETEEVVETKGVEETKEVVEAK